MLNDSRRSHRRRQRGAEALSPPAPVWAGPPAGRWWWINLRNGAMPALTQCQKPEHPRRVPPGTCQGGVFVICKVAPLACAAAVNRTASNAKTGGEVFYEMEKMWRAHSRLSIRSRAGECHSPFRGRQPRGPGGNAAATGASHAAARVRPPLCRGQSRQRRSQTRLSEAVHLRYVWLPPAQHRP